MGLGLWAGTERPGPLTTPTDQTPKHDWEALFAEWTKSGVSKEKFLRSKGIKPDTGSVKRHTRDWLKRVRAAQATVHQRTNERGTKDARVANVVPIDRKTAVAEVMQADTAGVPETAQPTSWQIINRWRARQCDEDYKTADRVRTHVKLLLSGAMERKTEVGADGLPRDVFKSVLKPHEIKALVDALGNIQRIQRLALGMSTENIGIDATSGDAGTHVEKQAANAASPGPTIPAEPTEEAIPTFVVEMSRRGKFQRARPRRLK